MSSPARDFSRGKGTQVAKTYAVYMVASRRNGTLYIGVTSDLPGRIWQHRNNTVDGFTRKYGIHLLVWYEFHEDIRAAITREKQIKGWNRDWKIRLIEKKNSGWNDLYLRING
jgi:putative endonuclease